MSESPRRTGGPTADPTAKKPRAVVHKRILDVARDKPDAPIATLAGEVSGASADLVERVLEEYGDPADSSGPGTDGPDGADSAAGQGVEADSGDSTDVEAADPQTGSDSAIDAASHEDGDDQSETDPEGQRAELTLLNGEADPSNGSGNDPSPVSNPEPDDESGTSDRDGGPADGDGVPDPGELDERQLAVLRAVRERPTATQKELAASLGVSRATVSKRVNRIEGFDWQDRAAFVDRLFSDGDLPREARGPDPDGPGPSTESTPVAGTGPAAATGSVGCRRTGRDLEAAVGELADRVATLSERIDDVDVDPAASGGTGALANEPELAHKVVHACFESDQVSRDEELRLLRTMLDE